MRPIGDCILVRRVEPQREKGGLHLVEEVWRNEGEVLALGSRVKDPEIVVGSHVLFKPRAASALVPDARERSNPEWLRLIVLREEDLLMIIET